MKKVIVILVIIVVGGFFIHAYMGRKAKRDAESAEAKRIEQTTKIAVSQMVLRTSAIDDWEKNLSRGERFRSEPILTIELERLWVQQRPILFVGAIKDIATHGESQYLVILERGLFGSFTCLFDTELQLSLVSSQAKIDSLLKENPSLFEDYGFNNGVAVVARVHSVRTLRIRGPNGELEEVKIGEGELLDILYTGNVQF